MTGLSDTPITLTVDLDAEGVQHGFMKLPYSHDASAWGSLMIPITVARRGVSNLLRHAGILAGTPEIGPTVELDMPDGRCFVSCESNGVFEPLVALGASVAKGQPVARVFDAQRTGTPPRVYESPLDGVFTARHHPGLVAMGDIVCVVAVPV
ncbi:MAG: succinylglutamate desuccinylase/aspartoacylase family protein [Pseudomonadota bacterium]